MHTAVPGSPRQTLDQSVVPPVPHGLMADVEAALTQKIFALSQREGVADRHHDREADDLRRTGERTTGMCASPEVMRPYVPAQADLL